MLPNEQLDAAMILQQLLHDVIQSRDTNKRKFEREWNRQAAKLSGKVPMFYNTRRSEAANKRGTAKHA